MNAAIPAAMDVPSIEAISVVFAAVLVGVSALVQSFSKPSASDRSASPPLQDFYGRATRTLGNNMESALMWVPTVVVILVLHRTTWISQLSAGAYIAARVVYSLSYWLKIPAVRTFAWFVGMVCCGAVAVLAVLPIT